VAKTAPVTQDDSFESLREAFHERLESERVHFVTLSAALARADENPVWIFEDLVYRAHRLQGGAAIFEESEVARAAGRLESAAGVAAQSRADNTDEDVWSALEALVNLMGNIESVRAMANA
jgi:HPt (histidine-containing phosphotransfer) domain-containing protein